MTTIRFTLSILFLCTCLFAGTTHRQTTYSRNTTHLYTELHKKTPNLNPKALKLGLHAYQKAKRMGLARKPIITIVDFSKPSTQKRLWVIDLSKKRVLFNELVAHGRNSGNVRATHFSNKVGSHQSSIGTFVTGNTYRGRNGFSMRLRGLEKGVNDNAIRRAIVVHGSKYVNQYRLRNKGRIGRSWGCPAVAKSITRSLINRIKNGSLFFAYYPDQRWLSHSKFV